MMMKRDSGAEKRLRITRLKYKQAKRRKYGKDIHEQGIVLAEI